MQVYAIIALDEPEPDFSERPGAWCPSTATVIVADKGDPIVLQVDVTGWVGYGASIPVHLHDTARKAGHIGGLGSMNDFQVLLKDDDWHAGKAGADLAINQLGEERSATLGRVLLEDPDADDAAATEALWEAISDAILDAKIVGVDGAEQAYLRDLLCYQMLENGRAKDRAAAKRTAAAIADEITLEGWDGCETDAAWLDHQLDQLPDEPVGDIRWDDAYGYVACLFGDDGAQPGDCYTRVGCDEAGQWWVDDGDEAERCDEEGPFSTEEVAKARAEELAMEQNEAEPGEDAEDMKARLTEEARRRATPDGEWIVGWVDPERGGIDPGRRYDDREDAEREIDTWHDAVLASTPNAIIRLMIHPVLCAEHGGELVQVEDES